MLEINDQLIKNRSDISRFACEGSMGAALMKALPDDIVVTEIVTKMLWYLTQEALFPVMAMIGRLVLEGKWKIPRSLMERLASTESKTWSGDQYVEVDKRYKWEPVLIKLGIPCVVFSSGNTGADPVPQSLVNQIVGKLVPYPLVVTWQNQPYVAVLANIKGRLGLRHGEWLHPSVIIEDLALAEAKYFDLDQ